MPEVEYLKVNYNCVDEQTTGTVRDSFIVPFESGIRLKCGNIWYIFLISYFISNFVNNVR